MVELRNASLAQLRALTYFEVSFYNDVQHPFLTTEEVLEIVRELPTTIKETCIYSQDEVYDVVKWFICPEIT